MRAALSADGVAPLVRSVLIRQASAAVVASRQASSEPCHTARASIFVTLSPRPVVCAVTSLVTEDSAAVWGFWQAPSDRARSSGAV
ncbi:hypothetical protein D3C81_1642980 [compost metagenome]